MDRTKLLIALGTLAIGTGWTFDREIVEFIDDVAYAIVKTLYEMIE